jgi:hypothetical protein
LPTTPLHLLPYPDQTVATVGPDVPADIKAFADAVDSKLTPFSNAAGTPAALGIAAGKPGRRHRDTINGDIWLDIGAAWLVEEQGLTAGDGISVVGATVSLKRIGGLVSGLGVTGDGAYVATDEVTLQRSGADVRVKAGGISAGQIANTLKPSAGAAAAAEALRALGTTAGTAAPGDDSRLHIFLRGSVAWSPGLMSAGGIHTQTFGVPGAAVGDLVIPTFTGMHEYLILNAWVITTGIVKAALHNRNTSAFDPGAGTLRVIVIGQ